MFSKSSRQRNEEIQRAVAVQKEENRQIYFKRERDLIEKYHTEKDEIYKKHNVEIEQLHKTYGKKIAQLEEINQVRAENERNHRIVKYKQQLKEKDDFIKKMSEEFKTIKKEYKRNVEAWESSKTLIEYIFKIFDAMKDMSDRIRTSSASLDQYFAKLHDMSDFCKRRLNKMEPEIEKKLYGDMIARSGSDIDLIEHEQSFSIKK